MNDRPAILGGSPAFGDGLAFAQPTIEEPSKVLQRISGALDSGYVTDGPTVAELERRVAETFGVDHCVAVSSCTIGLMLVIQQLRPTGPVLVPSFTFSATAHAARWNAADIQFGDCDPGSWTLRPEDIYDAPAVIVGVHVSGVPCDVAGLQARADELGAQLIFDAAHGSGSLTTVGGERTPLGRYGRAEVFSLTPTKVLSGAEGGLITTNDEELAARLRLARNYGNPGDYDTRFAGLNARLSEPHAALALQSLDYLEPRVVHRNKVAARYQAAMSEVPGISFQQVPDGDRSSQKDYTILIDESEFGATREAVSAALTVEGIAHRKYYSPPVHRQTAYRDVISPDLPITDRLAQQVISLPMWSHLPLETADTVAEAVGRIQANADAVQEAAAAPEDD